jgi:hypothetical protein
VAGGIARAARDRRSRDADQKVGGGNSRAALVGIVPIDECADRPGLRANLGEFEYAGKIETEVHLTSKVASQKQPRLGPQHTVDFVQARRARYYRVGA